MDCMTNPFHRCTDDSAEVRCIKEADEGDFRAVVDNFAMWCEQNRLQFNMLKTNELVADMRRT